METDKVFRLLGLATRAGKIAFGYESVVDTINKNKAKLVLVAEDASERTKRNILRIAQENNVQVKVYGNIEKISSNIGKENKAVVCIKDVNFSKEMLKIIDGGEAIG